MGALEQLGLVVAADVNGPMHAPASLTDDETHLPDAAARGDPRHQHTLRGQVVGVGLEFYTERRPAPLQIGAM
jgi:hypothetical protein